MKKMFTEEKTFNKENDTVYEQSPKEARKLVPMIERGHYLVWSYDGITSLHFCEKGIKTAVRNYQQEILINVWSP